jgi:hypothetical protein
MPNKEAVTLKFHIVESICVSVSSDSDRLAACLEIDGINYHLERIRKSELLTHYKVDSNPDYDPQADKEGYCYLLAPYSAA